jgi:hypothetical protein
LLKENPPQLPKFLKNKYFFHEKCPSFTLIPEKDVFLKGKCPSFARIFERYVEGKFP